MIFYKVVTFSYVVIISIAFLIPLDNNFVTEFVEEANQPSKNISFLIHFFIFFILQIFCYYSFYNKFFFLIFIVAYAFIIEIMQILTFRGFEILDIVFNLLGLFVSYLLLRILKIK